VSLHPLAHDPVRVEFRRAYARLDFDVWPRRLTEAGQNRLRAILRANCDRGFSYGASGCHCDRIDAAEAADLADELRELALDSECIEAIA